MTKLLRRTLLVSSTALMAITFIPVLGSIVPGPLADFIATEAQARGGDDDDDSGSESDDSGRDSDSDRDDSDDDSSGRDRDDDDDDSSGRDHDSSDDDDDDDDDSRGRGRGRGGDDDDDSDDDDDDDHRGRGRGGDRDEIRLIVNDSQLSGLLSGSMVAVDQNGKRLGFEVEEEHGQTEIKLRAPKGTLTGVTVIPAP